MVKPLALRQAVTNVVDFDTVDVTEKHRPRTEGLALPPHGLSSRMSQLHSMSVAELERVTIRPPSQGTRFPLTSSYLFLSAGCSYAFVFKDQPMVTTICLTPALFATLLSAYLVECSDESQQLQPHLLHPLGLQS